MGQIARCCEKGESRAAEIPAPKHYRFGVAKASPYHTGGGHLPGKNETDCHREAELRCGDVRTSLLPRSDCGGSFLYPCYLSW